MAARVAVVEGGRVYQTTSVERLWFFPNCSEYLRYSPHFHVIARGGFRQNLPLSHMFVVVFEGKLSIKNYWGETQRKIHVQDQVWFYRGTSQRAQGDYAKLLRLAPVYASPRPVYG